MVSLRIVFLFVFSVASAVIIQNLGETQNQYNPYSLYNQPYQLYPPTPLHPRFFILKTLGLGKLVALASLATANSGLFGNFSLQFPKVQSCNSTLTGRGCGSCLSLPECLFRRGFPAGICNLGLKTCCVSKGRSSIPVASFTKTSQTTSPATFTILRTSPEFCQVRVDFQTFSISAPDQQGICTGGFWTVAGQADTNVPVLCGLNDGQHVYLNFNGGTPITMTVVSNDLQNDDWNIKITQIRCSDTANRAPFGCLQYYPDSSGEVRSFNFREVSTQPGPSVNVSTHQLSNLNYNVCLGSPTNSFNSISWTRGTGTTSYYFVLTSFIALYSPSVAGTVNALDTDPRCSTTSNTQDYVEIMNGVYTDGAGMMQTRDQFCGAGFPAQVTSTVKPFRLHVVTNSFEDFREGSVGFALSYTLNP